MQRTLSVLLSLALVLGLFSACQEEGRATPGPTGVPSSASPAPAEDLSAQELAELVFPYSGCREPEAVERLNAGEDAGTLTFYIENAYELEEDAWEDAAVIRAAGASAFEVAVLRCSDAEAAVFAAINLSNYTVSREGDFTGYAPAEADMASKGSLAQKGPFVALFICPEPDLAVAAFHAALDGTPMPDPGAVVDAPPPASTTAPSKPSNDPQWPDRVAFIQPNIDDMSLYDTTAIRSAWSSGDPSGLSDYDRDIYNAAQKVLKKALKKGMSDYEKEKAIYNWIVNNVDYDWTHQDVMKETPRESFGPYGGLVNHTAVCLGYATTFQLLCDFTGMECLTVVGASRDSTSNHAWNMVRLNGNWYCVDATWDANYREYGATKGREKEWMFFNVTSDFMAATDHQWDYVNTPEAVTAGNER